MIPAAIPLKNSQVSEEVPTRVLIVDEEPLIRWALSIGLGGAGFDAVAVATAAEARAFAIGWPPPSVVLLDLHHEHGKEVWRDLRLALPRCQVIALGTSADARRALGASVEMIPKPFDLADVLARVRAACQRIRSAAIPQVLRP